MIMPADFASRKTASLPQMCGALVTFAAFVIRSQVDGSNPLSIAQAFTSLAIISLITSPSLQLLASIPALTAATAAFDRVHGFLICSTKDTRGDYMPKESTPDAAQGDGKSAQTIAVGIEMSPLNSQKHGLTSSLIPSEEAILTISEAYIRPAPSSQFQLQNINLTIRPGCFTILTGPVGCGKSVLLKAVMGEISCEKGRIYVHEKGIAYCECLSLADEVVVLDSQGCVVQQGPFQPMRLTDEIIEPAQFDLPGDSDKNTPPSKKELTVPKLLTPEIISDMSRQTGDIAVYSYYLKAIGWPLVLGACVIILIYTFAANFPRELSSYQIALHIALLT
ncbi:hypothetical protein EIK77_009910 [Talaromyces pinophilus]|nr:hypothetical protein EIK77_009910 [Talaromyces pinophilus]